MLFPRVINMSRVFRTRADEGRGLYGIRMN